MDDKKIVKSFHIQDELNPDIWMESEGMYVMKPEIREKLLEIGGDFMDFLDVGLVIDANVSKTFPFLSIIIL